MSKEQITDSVFQGRVAACLADSTDAGQLMRGMVEAVDAWSERYTWVGVYLLRGDTLELPAELYIGAEPLHTEIAIAEGVCGAAARENATQFVPDVNKDPRYLACSVTTKSELVVPISDERGVIGVLDIDSDFLAAFGDEEQRALEEACDSIASRYRQLTSR